MDAEEPKVITNDDVLALKSVSDLPDDLHEWIMCNYKMVGEKSSTPMTPEMWKYKWETACRRDNDWKYGRFMVCRDRMLWRKLTMDEFYGGGVVD